MTKLSTALWTDLKTDKERGDWLLLGRGYETGVVAHALQADLAMAYHQLAECKADAERYRWLCDNKYVPWGTFLTDAHELGIDAAIDAARSGKGEI